MDLGSCCDSPLVPNEHKHHSQSDPYLLAGLYLLMLAMFPYRVPIITICMSKQPQKTAGPSVLLSPAFVNGPCTCLLKWQTVQISMALSQAESNPLRDNSQL